MSSDSQDSTAGSSDLFGQKFSVCLSGEVAYHIIEAAGALNIKPSLYAKMMVTDGLKNAGLLPKWWKRGKMNFDK